MPDLLHHALVEDRHPVRHRHCLGLIVGDVDDRRLQAIEEQLQLGAHLHAQLGIEVGERFIQQEESWLPHQGPAERHPLSLPAGELSRPAIEQLRDAEQIGGARDFLGDGLPRFVAHFEGEGQVVAHAHVRVEGVALEDHGDVPVAGVQAADLLLVDEDLALGDVLQPGEHVERRALATPRRSDERHELPIGNVEIEVG